MRKHMLRPHKAEDGMYGLYSLHNLGVHPHHPLNPGDDTAHVVNEVLEHFESYFRPEEEK